MRKKSQCEMILKYLQTHTTGITPLQALNKFGCLRLSGRIYDLKDQGYNILTNMVEVKTADGDVSRVAQYRLVR